MTNSCSWTCTHATHVTSCVDLVYDPHPHVPCAPHSIEQLLQRIPHTQVPSLSEAVRPGVAVPPLQKLRNLRTNAATLLLSQDLRLLWLGASRQIASLDTACAAMLDLRADDQERSCRRRATVLALGQRKANESMLSLLQGGGHSGAGLQLALRSSGPQDHNSYFNRFPPERYLMFDYC